MVFFRSVILLNVVLVRIEKFQYSSAVGSHSKLASIFWVSSRICYICHLLSLFIAFDVFDLCYSDVYCFKKSYAVNHWFLFWFLFVVLINVFVLNIFE